LEQSQNKDEKLQPQTTPAVEERKTSLGFPETISNPPKQEGETPTLPLQSPNLSTEDLSNTDPEHKADTMEVQKHPHHVMHKKKWGEYLLEFFMLFLAVFLGFLAENYREHVVEKERAHQYALQLISDLQTDSAQLDSSILLNAMISRKLDTLRRFIDQKNYITTGQLYYYGRFTTWYNRLTPNDATIQQMKSSGGIRYFHNPRIENMISEYDRLVRRLQVHETSEYNSLTEMWLLTGQIYRGDILDSLNDLDKPGEYYSRFMQKDYPLVTADPVLLERLSNLCRARQLWIRYKIDENLKPALKSAKKLMEQLKKELK
jgi:hypothetical protein